MMIDWPAIIALSIAIATALQICVLFGILCRQSIGGVARMTLKIIFGVLLFLCMVGESLVVAELFLGKVM